MTRLESRLGVGAIAMTLGFVVLIACGCGDARMASASMSPTIRRGEKVKINYAAYAMDGPQRWDVVAFEPLDAPGLMWVSRVVGLPGETVSFEKGEVMLNGRTVDVPAGMSNITYVSIDHSAFNNVGSGIAFPFVVPKDHYFVLGDNSTNANDSRFWGGVARSNILGKVMVE